MSVGHARVLGLLAVALMIITMILIKRGEVRRALTRDLPGTGWRHMLANNWHLLAIGVLLLMWMLSGALCSLPTMTQTSSRAKTSMPMKGSF